jgi:hypothetical protein
VLDQLPDSAAISEISGVRMVYDSHSLLTLTYVFPGCGEIEHRE